MKYGMIPFFIPHVGCPHVCTFCNQSRITGQSGISHLTPDYIQQTIKDYVGTYYYTEKSAKIGRAHV